MKELKTPRQISDYLYEIMLMDKFNEITEIITSNGVVEFYNPSFGLTDKRAVITCPIFLSTYYDDLKNEYDNTCRNTKIIIAKIQAISAAFHEKLMADDIDYFLANEIQSIEMSIQYQIKKLHLNSQQGGNTGIGEKRVYIKFSDNTVKLYTSRTAPQKIYFEHGKRTRIWSEVVIPSVCRIFRDYYGDGKYLEYHSNFFQGVVRNYFISLAI